MFRVFSQWFGDGVYVVEDILHKRQGTMLPQTNGLTPVARGYALRAYPRTLSQTPALYNYCVH